MQTAFLSRPGLPEGKGTGRCERILDGQSSAAEVEDAMQLPRSPRHAAYGMRLMSKTRRIRSTAPSACSGKERAMPNSKPGRGEPM
ncbi:MAG: hypothetical protein NVSMB18_29980 [Acetobacteraceae bacterium]